MSEETKRAQRGSPYGILFSIAGATVVGWVFLLSITFCIQDFATQIAGPNAVQPQMVQVFLDGVGLNWAVVFCVIIMGGMFFCGSALTLGSSRMVYAFSRDGAMVCLICWLGKGVQEPNIYDDIGFFFYYEQLPKIMNQLQLSIY